MARRVLLVSSMVLTLFGCSYNNVEVVKPGEPVLTLLSDANVGKGAVNWLMIHDARGNLLSAQKYVPGDAVVATSNAVKAGDIVSVTFMQYSITQGYGGYTYNLSTYLNILVHDTWTSQILTSPQNDRTYLGSFKVTAMGFPITSRINISNVYGGFASFLFDGSTASYATDLGVDTGTKNFFVSCRDPQGNLEYKFLPNIQTGDEYIIGPTDLQAAESSMQVPLTGMTNYFLNVAGVPSSESPAVNGYIAHYDYMESPLPASVSIWFPAVFTSFRTTLGMTNSNGTYYFNSVGPKPNDIAMPTNQVFKITNRTIQNFQLTGNSDFQRRTSTWEFHNWQHGENPALMVDIVWTVYSPLGADQKILQLPSNFGSVYPDLKLDKLIHTGTTLGLQGSTTYDELITGSFKGQSPTVRQTYYSVRLN
ncbi:MAG TPA: hypothetical protein VL728_13555 [Cyclobacteriaceae bacterium]|nr:hypothetical protein [Cyclobacteriaceae bacterium]